MTQGCDFGSPGVQLPRRISPPRLPLRKRVALGGRILPFRRKLVYRSRRWISASSHRVFALARTGGWPRLYLVWARLTLRAYEGIAYLRGPLGRLLRRVEGGGVET